MGNDVSVSQLLSDPMSFFPLIWDTESLRRTVENNDWHKHQDVLGHTYKVVLALEKLLERELDHFDVPEAWQGIFIAYMHAAIDSGNSRYALLRVAGLFHDVGKPGTLRVSDDYRTSCPDHTSKSAALFSAAARGLGLSREAEQYVKCIIQKHHLPDTFIDYVGSPDYEARKHTFLSETAGYSIDLLVFYIADFEGCDAIDNIDAAKPQIYGELVKTIVGSLSRREGNVGCV